MGSYDTSESDSSYTPRRSFSSGGSSGSSSPRSSGASVPPQESRSPPASEYDPALPVMVALGGGLTPSRIVKKIPDEIKSGKLLAVVNYLISEQVLATKEEIAISEAVKERMRAADYRAIINNFYNYHNERLGTDDLSAYLQKKERTTEAGVKAFNFCDIAIVSHDEGGKDLDEMIEEVFK